MSRSESHDKHRQRDDLPRYNPSFFISDALIVAVLIISYLKPMYFNFEPDPYEPDQREYSPHEANVMAQVCFRAQNTLKGTIMSSPHIRTNL